MDLLSLSVICLYTLLFFFLSEKPVVEKLDIISFSQKEVVGFFQLSVSFSTLDTDGFKQVMYSEIIQNEKSWRGSC